MKLRGLLKLLIFTLLFSAFTPARVLADDTNPSFSEIDNYANLVISGSQKQGFTMLNKTILNSSNTNFTFEAWVNPSDSTTSITSNLFEKQNSVIYRLVNDKVEVAYLPQGGSWGIYTSTVTLRTNEWQHLAISKSGTSVSIYVNGSLVGSISGVTNTIASNTNQFTIGASVWDGATNQNRPSGSYYAGGIDEVKLWDSARTQSQIQTSMQTKIAGSTSGLIAYWDFNGIGDLSTIYDRTSNGFNLTVYDSPTFPDIKSIVNSVGYSTITFTRTYLNSASGFQMPTGVSTINLLVVGGGGSGGYDGGGGGGGGGVYQNSSVPVIPGNRYNIEVGGGGARVSGYVNNSACDGSWSSTIVGCNGASGVSSKFGIYSASGGGAGGGIENSGAADSDATANARGGGGGAGGQNSKSGVGSPGVGGATGGSVTDTSGVGGGGGASGSTNGSNGTSSAAGAGASGITASINSVVYGSGGAGGSFSSATVAQGGAGAANGGTTSVGPTSPIANRGGGGAGGGNGGTPANAYGSSGAAGIIIIKYALTGSASLSVSPSPRYRTITTITAATSVEGKVTFFANGKKISGCIKRSTNLLSATCSWKPSQRGSITLSATVLPTDTNYSSYSSAISTAFVTQRVVNR